MTLMKMIQWKVHTPQEDHRSQCKPRTPHRIILFLLKLMSSVTSRVWSFHQITWGLMFLFKGLGGRILGGYQSPTEIFIGFIDEHRFCWDLTLIWFSIGYAFVLAPIESRGGQRWSRAGQWWRCVGPR
jgi:hypothetical protein